MPVRIRIEHTHLDIDNGFVHFSYRDYEADGQQKEMRLPAVEFMRRFLQHQEIDASIGFKKGQN
ncbi:MAG: transposase [Anaerolineales bacterium]|nr:transposase [Anaerolineales bacterium]